ncbi:hypothetical protein G5714_018313 [Onychostoma macrolepis]|uniref:NACHT domain-containing protein n=1 Tax=Onychostoma macrolepis TaxID=369639 RepID=A0A7J6BYR9_9TELE|nr:hypothetical protein G5714_018313 [Onychostoma macrolepis]
MHVSNKTHLDGQMVHEMRELERPYNEDIKDENVINYDDLLKPHCSMDGRIRTIMMRGISGSGKSTAVRKFVLDWADGKTHQHIDFVFPLHLCELNILHDKKFSLMQLLDLLFPKLLKPETLEQSQILFIWDGLGEFRFPLNFKCTKTCTDPVTPVSVGCMLVNLLKGNLLPSAQILVTSRLKDAGLIPPEHIQEVVELHGFDDLQWEEHIRSEVCDKAIAVRATVHVKSSRTLYIMRSLPFFCQMASTVLEELFSNSCNTDPPLTLTEMFTHFLLIQMKRQVEKSAKSSTEEILKLGKLAWHMLEKDTLTFMEKDQRETNTDPLLPVKLSEDWPMFFKKQNLMGLGKMYRFTHPIVQEFLAALLDGVTDLSWALIASTLRSPANRIREIDIEKKALIYIKLDLLSLGLRSPNCKVEILRTPYCGYPKDALLSGILLNPTHLRELKLLSSFHMSDRTVESISQILMNPDCHLEKLTLLEMETLESKILAAALCSSSCCLRELDLSRCSDQALQLLLKAFRHPNFKITVLR